MKPCPGTPWYSIIYNNWVGDESPEATRDELHRIGETHLTLEFVLAVFDSIERQTDEYFRLMLENPKA